MNSLMLTAPVLPQMIRLAVPNLMAMIFTTGAAATETYFFGLLGVAQLAGHAVVFPLVMLQHMMGAGSLGGAVSSSVSRALGANDAAKAQAVGLHGLILGALAGGGIAALLLLFGVPFLQLLGASGEVLTHAWAYLSIVALGFPGIWIMNGLISTLRGRGQMKPPSYLTMATAALQIALSLFLGFGLDLGIAGIAWGQVIAYTLGALAAVVMLLGGPEATRLRLDPSQLDRRIFAELLRTGALACLSPVQATLTAMFLTAYLAAQGPAVIAGYGIGARLEFLLIPIAFSIGVGSVPMVGMAVGAGDFARAKTVGWTGGLLGGGILGLVGIAVAVFPWLWAGRFTDDPRVLEIAAQYFRWAGPGYALLGFSMCLYFAFQGAGRVGWPIFAGTLRLGVVVGLGYALTRAGVPSHLFFSVVLMGLMIFGGVTAWRFHRLAWR